MSSFGVLLLCIQGCLIHNVVSQCLAGPNYGYGPGIGPGLPGAGLIGPYGAPGIAPGYPGYGVGAPGIPGPGLPGVASYGGSGIGDVAVIGELPVAGTTVVTGQVPIMGSVQFGGPVPAAGAVTISGFCSCGCNPPGYGY